jgi:D-alanyl-D-alanine dipeptidase
MQNYNFIQQIKEKAAKIDKKMFEVLVVDNKEKLVDLRENTSIKCLSRDPKGNEQPFWVRETVAKKLININENFKKYNRGLVIRDAWRSTKRQRKYFEKEVKRLEKIYPDKTRQEIEKQASIFVMPPGLSPHLTGGAVDVAMIDLKTGKVVDFGTKDQRSELCFTDHPKISSQARKNRELLLKVFFQEDFVNYILEYWHFSYGNAEWAAYKNKDRAFYGAIEVDE